MAHTAYKSRSIYQYLKCHSQNSPSFAHTKLFTIKKIYIYNCIYKLVLGLIHATVKERHQRNVLKIVKNVLKERNLSRSNDERTNWIAFCNMILDNHTYCQLNFKLFVFVIKLNEKYITYFFPEKKMVSFQDVLTFLLFGMESFHFIGHCLIMFRVRQLPRKDFVRMRFYFIVDPLSVFLSSFVVLGKLQWLTSIQLLQHLYYFLMWEQTDAAKKVKINGRYNHLLQPYDIE